MSDDNKYIEVRRDEHGNWWRRNDRGVEKTYYMGEDARILDILLLPKDPTPQPTKTEE